MNPLLENERLLPWRELALVLAELKASGRRVLFIANPGNAGDALIASATWQFFDQIGFNPVAGRREDIRPGDAVILGGGGNFIPLYSGVHDSLQHALRSGAWRVVLLPHTVRGHEPLLTALDDRCILFCRDRLSFEHVQRHALHARVFLAPDMALSLRVDQLLARVAQPSVQWSSVLASLRQGRLTRYVKWLVRSGALRPEPDGRLEVLRRDIEAAHEAGPKSHDLSGLFHSALQERNICDTVSGRFLSVIDRARTVRTDRLHVAIAAQLLGKPVELLDNSYGKNHAVASTWKDLMPLVSLSENTRSG